MCVKNLNIEDDLKSQLCFYHLGIEGPKYLIKGLMMTKFSRWITILILVNLLNLQLIKRDKKEKEKRKGIVVKHLKDTLIVHRLYIISVHLKDL